MAFVDSYDDLIQSIQSYCARTDPTFVGQLSNFVGFAEDRIFNGVDDPNDQLKTPALRVKEMFVTQMLSPDSNLEYTVPSRCLGFRTIDTLGRGDIEYLAPDAFKTRVAFGNGGQSRWYTIEGDKIKLEPGTEEDIEVTFYQRPLDLGVSQQTNGIIELYGNTYLAAAMFEAMTFLQMEGAQAWLMRLNSQINGANNTANAVRYGGGKRRTQPRQTIGANLRW